MKSITLMLVLILAMSGLAINSEAETVMAGPYTVDVNPGFSEFTTTIQGPVVGECY